MDLLNVRPDPDVEMMNNIVASSGRRKTIGAAWLWQYGNSLHKGLSLAFNLFGLPLLVAFFFCSYSYAEPANPPEKQKEKLISITLGQTTFKLPSPVHLDGKWVDHDAQGVELSFPIRAAELYKRFDTTAADNPSLAYEKFEVSLVYVKGSDINRRKSDEFNYIHDGRWEKTYLDTDLGLLVYESIPKLVLGWGSPVYYPLDEKYTAPDGLPFRISCNRVYGIC